MTKRIQAATALATFLLLGASSVSMAQEAPVSSLSESRSPVSAATTQAAPNAGQAAAPAAQQGALSTTQAAPSLDVSDEKLQKFVASAQQVAVMSQQYGQQLRSVSDQGAQQQLMQQANQKMVQTVQANGLTVQEFNDLSEAVDRDPALQQRAQRLLQ
jgi:hypothetical protein